MTDRNEDSMGCESAIDKMLNDAEVRLKEITTHRDRPDLQSTVDVVRDAFEAIKRTGDDKLNERNEWQAWRERITAWIRRADPDIELSDDDLRRRQDEVDAQCAKVTDEEIEAVFKEMASDDAGDKLIRKPSAMEQARQVLGKKAAILLERPLTEAEERDFKLKLSFAKMDHDAKQRRASERKDEEGASQGESDKMPWEVRIEQRQKEDAIRDSLTDADVEAELQAVTQVVSERRKRELDLEDARKWARNAVAEMKTKRADGIATERDEAKYEEEAEMYLRMVRRAGAKLAACPAE